MTTTMQDGTPAPTRGVPIMLDKQRYLRYSLRTIRALREEFGASMLTDGLSDEKIAKVLWYGLKDSDPSLTEATVEELIDLENLPVLLDALSKAMGYKKGKMALLEAEDGANPPVASAGAEVPVAGERAEALS